MGQIVQIAGALAILAAFALAQVGVLRTSSYAYLVLNVVGASVLAVEAWLETQWGFLLLEAAWAVVAASALVGLDSALVERWILDVVLGRVLVDELVDDVHPLVEGVVDLHERLPFLRERVLGEDRLDRALRLARTAVDALLGIDHEHALGLVDAVHRAHVHAGLVQDVDAGLGDDVRHFTPVYATSSSTSCDARSASAERTTTLSRPAAWAARRPAVSV